MNENKPRRIMTSGTSRQASTTASTLPPIPDMAALRMAS